MENIYVSHSTSYDYKKELYEPIKKSKIYIFDQINIVFPHANSEEQYDSKEYLKTCKYMIAEVSYPSFGLGIELGWANLYGTRIVCIYKKGAKLSKSLKVISVTFIEYESINDLTLKLDELFLSNILKENKMSGNEQRDNTEPTYANINETFVKLMGYIAFILKFDSYKESYDEYNDILSIIGTWAVKYEKSRDLSFISPTQLSEIYKRIDDLQTKYICNDAMGSESELSDYVVNWMWRLRVIYKKFTDERNKEK